MFTGLAGSPSYISSFDGFLLGVEDVVPIADGTFVAAVIYSVNVAAEYPNFGSLNTIHLQQFDVTGTEIGPRYILDDDDRSPVRLQSITETDISVTPEGAIFASWASLDIQRVYHLRHVETVLDGTSAPNFDTALSGGFFAYVSSTALTGPGAVVAWADPIYDGSGDVLYGVIAVDDAGERIEPFSVFEAVSSTSASFQLELVPLIDGGFVSLWNQGFQVFEADGTPRTGFIPITATGTMPQSEFASFTPSAIVALSDGGFAIAGGYDDGLATDTGLFLLRYDALGQVVSDPDADNTVYNWSPFDLQVELVEDGSGNPVLVWNDTYGGHGVYVAHSDASGGLHEFGLVSLGLEDEAPFGGFIDLISVYQLPDGEAGLFLKFDDEFGIDRPADGYYHVTLAGAVIGTDSDDLLTDRAGPQRFLGYLGEDTADFRDAAGRVLVDLQTDVSGSGFARFFSDGAGAGDVFDGIEHVMGSSYADNLRGDAGANLLAGGSSSDRLYGRSGDDTLEGGAGADALFGNLGADVLIGGDDSARDRFIFFNLAESTPDQRDTITDFTPGEDRIEISRFDADITQGFKQRFDWIGDAAFSGTAGELGYRNEGGNTIVQADVDGDAVADFEIELTGTMSLSESDFLI